MDAHYIPSINPHHQCSSQESKNRFLLFHSFFLYKTVEAGGGRCIKCTSIYRRWHRPIPSGAEAVFMDLFPSYTTKEGGGDLILWILSNLTLSQFRLLNKKLFYFFTFTLIESKLDVLKVGIKLYVCTIIPELWRWKKKIWMQHTKEMGEKKKKVSRERGAKFMRLNRTLHWCGSRTDNNKRDLTLVMRSWI